MKRLAVISVRVLAWALLGAGLVVIALNPGVPSGGYALLWLGIMAVARGLVLLLGWSGVPLDLSLVVLCFLGMETGGLILVPSVVAFTLADAFEAALGHRQRT
jgi:hypothetical protein